MMNLTKWKNRIRFLLCRGRFRRELDEEMRFHREMKEQELLEAGLSPDNARHAAARRFGNQLRLREESRETWGWNFIENFGQDARYALRVFRKNPGFTAIAALSLGIGIGANTAIFSLIDKLILKPLPVADPARLVRLKDPAFSYPIFEQVRDRADVFEGVFAWTAERLRVQWDGEPVESPALLVSASFYETLGIRPVIGRSITTEDHSPSASPAAMISYNCWQRRFLGRPSAVGATVRVENVTFTVVGVTPPGFYGLAAGRAPEITVPIATLPLMRPWSASILSSSTTAWLHIMGRVKPGLSIPQADAAFQVIWPQVLDITTRTGVRPDRRHLYLSRTTRLEPGSTGYSPIRNQFAQPLLLLMALVGVVLLIACANLASLLLCKASARQRELAVRLAIGAGRGRLLRQLFTESLLLASLGAVAGLVFAQWSSRLLIALLSTSYNPISLQTGLDWRAAAFTAALTLLTAVVFGLAPAFRSLRIDAAPVLKSGGRGISGGFRLGKAFLIAQVALSMALLAGAGLLARSLANLMSTDAGFMRENLLLAHTDPLFAGLRGGGLIRFYEELLEQTRAIPGVRSAALSYVPPISNEKGSWTQAITVDGEAPVETKINNYFNAVSEGYFRTLGTPMLAGRDFSRRDAAGAGRVVIINETLARMYFPNADPIGRRIGIGRHESRQSLEIVGVVKDSKYRSLQEPNRPIAYLPYLQLPEFLNGSNLTMEIRTEAPAETIFAAVRERTKTFGGNVPMACETLSRRVDESLVKERLIALLSAFFGGVSLLLACIGFYGVIAYAVSRRTHEIGVRMALGAERASVVWMVVSESLLLVVAGVLAGLAPAFATARLMSGALFGVTPADPAVFAACAAALIAVALLASFLPARLASRIDPAVSLRCE